MTPKLRKFSAVVAAVNLLLFAMAMGTQSSLFIAAWFYSFPIAFGLMLWDLFTRKRDGHDFTE